MQKLIFILKPIINKLIRERSDIGTIINRQQLELKEAKDKQAESDRIKADIVEKALKKVESEKKEIERQNTVAIICFRKVFYW